MQHAELVSHDDVGGARLEQQLEDRGAGCSCTRHHHPASGQVLADHAQGVAERGQGDDRGAVLVVVEDRDVQLVAQPCLDLEAAGGGDVLEVDAGEDRADRLDSADDLLGVLGVEADREGIDVGEPLEQGRLALHHRQRGQRADVAQAEHGRTVGHHSHRVALDGQAARVSGVLRDGQADPRHARRVDQGEVVAVADRDLGLDLELAPQVGQEGAVGDLADLDPVHPAHRHDERIGVVGVAGSRRHVDA